MADFVRNVGEQVWITENLMRGQGWRDALLHRAFTAVFRASHHFGMPGWPGVVDAALERLAALDRQSAIRAWRRVRDELRHGSHSGHGPSAAGPPDREQAEGEPDGS
ncbi:hypothetical protein [Streptomyces sp. NPDC021224]|uniref:hypothetical protein n=1 Tax=unclassified Streptomyces TaxID=2593676 RepID=UPI00379F1AD5